MADKEITVLLMLEAIDKASSIFEKVSDKIKSIGDASKDAAAKAKLSGDDLVNAQVKAEAAANAAKAAEAAQAEAQTRLAETSEAARAAMAEQNAAEAQLSAAAEAVGKATGEAADVAKVAYAEMATAAESAATAAKLAVAEQVTALDGLKKADTEVATRTTESKTAQDALGLSTDKSGTKLKALMGISALTAAAVTGIGVESVKAASNFQSATTVLVTSGGETAQNIGMVRNGILQLAGSTGTATQELTNGMYMIGSAGYTGASGLNVLKASAQGAKAENADLGTVSNALTTVLGDYGVTATQVAGNQTLANKAMNQMVAIVQNGKTTTEDLASSLSSVLPTAASLKIGFDQVGGALATMTGQGMSAQRASMDLNHTIGSLGNPTAVMTKEMQALGINSNDLSKNIGKRGLTGTFEMLSDAITSHMGKDGLVVQNAFAASKQAAADADAEMAKMPATLQKLAQSYLNGSVTAKQWTADLNGLSPTNKSLMTEFATTANKTHQFNDLLKSGAPAAQTYNAAMSKMTGGTTGLQTALMLTGPNMDKFKANVKAVGDAGNKTGKDVNGWAEIQQTANQKLAELKQTANAAAIQLGTALLPAVTKLLSAVMDVLGPIASFIGQHKTLAAVILGVVGALAVGTLGIIAVGKTVKAVSGSFEALSGAWGKVGDVAGKVGKGFGTAKDFLTGLGGKLKDGATAAKEFGSNALEAAQNLGSSAWSAASDTLSSIGSGIASAAQATGQFIVSLAQSTLAIARQGIAIAAEKVEMMGAAIAEKAAAAAQWLLDAAEAASPLTLIIIAIGLLVAAFVMLWTKSAGFRDFWIGLWHDVQAITMIAVNAVVGFFTGLYHNGTAVIGEVVDWVKSHWQLLLAILTGPIGLAVLAISKYRGDIKQWFQDGVNKVSSVLSWFGSLPGKFRSWLGDVVTAAAEKVGDIETWFGQIPTKIKGLLADAGSWLTGIGRSILEGLINGAKSALGDVEGFFKGIGHDIVSWKGPPDYDKVMLTGNGQLIMQGLITGIDSQTEALHAKLGSITTSIQADVTGGTRAIAASASGLAPASPTGAGASAGTVINLSVTGNTVMSDADTDKLVTKIGNRLTQQILPSAGVRFNKR